MSTAADLSTERLIAELHKIDGKAEIVGDRIVHMSPTGRKPGRAGGAIYRSLCLSEKSAQGWAYPDNVAFLVDLPHRKSFAPDTAFSTSHRKWVLVSLLRNLLSRSAAKRLRS